MSEPLMRLGVEEIAGRGIVERLTVCVPFAARGGHKLQRFRVSNEVWDLLVDVSSHPRLRWSKETSELAIMIGGGQWYPIEHGASFEDIGGWDGESHVIGVNLPVGW